MSALGVSVDIEKSVISSMLNSVILLVFLIGVYTIIYFGTLYIYVARKSSKRALVLAAITIQYLSSMVGTGCQWYGVKWELVNNGDNRDSVFLALFYNPQWLRIAYITSFYIVVVIADGLLIWRCFFVWNSSWRIISVPLLLIFSEIALFIAEVALAAKYFNFIEPPAIVTTINDLLAAAFFMSFATTLVTTVLIASRIYSVSKQKGDSSRRFKHVIDIIVQSGAVYALSQLATAISGVIPNSNIVNTRGLAFQAYMESLNLAISGITVTVMVARVALISVDNAYPSTSGHLSGLQFQGRSTYPTVNLEGMGTSHSIVGDRNLAYEPSGEDSEIGSKIQ